MEVLVTGAAGTVGSALREHLPDEHDITGLDHVDGEGVDVVADLRDRDAVREAVAGHDAVVHLALNADVNVRVTDVQWFPAQQDNLQAVTNVFEAAVAEGVEAVPFASTNHVMGHYEEEGAPDIYEGSIEVGPDDAPRPDSLYGVGKLYDEALGRFAAEEHGLRTYALRLGGVRPAERDRPYPLPEHRDHGPGHPDFESQADHYEAVWCSRADCARLVDACLTHDAPAGAFEVLYGTSDNPDCWFDLDHGREAVGYHPQDSAADYDRPEP
jgi:nucleoside-diphosphate-sugar epimerase